MVAVAGAGAVRRAIAAIATMRASAVAIAGTMPARKKRTNGNVGDECVEIIGMDGGTSGPSVADTAEIAAAKPAG